METYHHGDLRPALLRAAARLLEKDGREAVALRDLARRAGVSHSAPYRHFADREALLAALAEEGFALLEVELRGKPWREQAGAYVRFALANPERFQLMFSGPAPAGLRRLIEATTVAQATWALVHGLAQLIQSGQFPDQDPEKLVQEALDAIRFVQRSA